MKGLTLEHIAQVCGGTYIGKKEDLGREVTMITTDSRKAEAGGLFAAIKGERVDGHDFIPSVFAQGALVVLGEQEPSGWRKQPETESASAVPGSGDPSGAAGNYIQVPSTVEALGAIAEYYLEQLQIPVVGITGSVGKTSTKEMIAAVLAQKYHVLKTAGNFNNALGLPLTIFRLREEHEIAVLELGINHFGEMHALAKIAKPNICVITNIGECHLEFLGDRDGVLRAKSEIFDYLRPDGAVILNGDDDKLAQIDEVKGIRPVFFGIDEAAGTAGEDKAGDERKASGASRDAVGGRNAIYADQIEKKGLDGIACRIHTGQGAFAVQVPLPGLHMVRNALAGTAVGLQCGLTLEQIRAGIESLQPLGGRFNIVRTEDYTIIDDCYNANPMSMRGSLEVLQDALGRKVAILGDMGELGADEARIHRELGEFAGGLDIDCCICVGTLCRHMADGIAAANPERETLYFGDPEGLLEALPGLVRKGDTILVKASHFMHFERVVERLKG